MAKGKTEKKENGAKAPKNGTSTTTIVGVEAIDTYSIKLYLSDGRELLVMSAGAGNVQDNAANRDVVVDALTCTIQAVASMPKASV